MWESVKPAQVQAALRQVFQRWGLPQRLRVDNGLPWGSRHDLPSDLSLWLIGLGVEMIWNRPAHPQENGIVERNHGTLKPWVEASQCNGLPSLQKRLERATRIQRESFRRADGQTRLAQFPSLTVVVRPYSPEKEATQWQLARVANFLGQGVYRRRADHAGRISLYNRYYAVGRAWAKRTVEVRFDPTTLEWLMHDEAGKLIIKHPAPEITTERICALEVTNRRVTKYQKQRLASAEAA